MIKILIAALILASNVAWAETATERAKWYFADIESGDFAAAASHFDAEGLKDFRSAMEFYKEAPDEAQVRFVQTFFGSEQTVASVDELSDIDFFASFFGFVMRQAEAIGGLNFDGMEILGEVKEGEEITHLVTRNRVTVGSIETEAMEVVSLKRNGDEWRVMMSGQIKGLPDQLRAAIGASGQ